MNLLRILLIVACLAPTAAAQLTTDQKVADFMQLTGLYAKNYAPYEWKRDVMGFDLYNVKPWLDQVKASKDDIEFYDICVRYVAALQDSHDEFTIPSDFYAYLHLDVDIYDGKVLIDGIDDDWLPFDQYPFDYGDEVIAVDGIPVETWINDHVPYAVNGSGNTSTRRRLSADTITFRYQSWFPKAHLVGDSSTLLIKGFDGTTSTYTIPWDKQGTPLTFVGPVPSPTANLRRDPYAIASEVRARRNAIRAGMRLGARAPIRRQPVPQRRSSNPWGAWTHYLPPAEPEALPPYMKTLKELQTMQAIDSPLGVAGFGSLFPAFNPPAGFKIRLGTKSADQFLSGTFPASGKTIGFIRIPTMSPTNTTTALNQFAGEIAYFNANTDGLVVDVMRNGGGSLCYTESLLRFLIPYPFRSVSYNIRATQFWVEVFSGSLYNAKATGAAQWVIDLYAAYLANVQQVLAAPRALTGPLPICGPTFENMQPFKDSKGNTLAYTKPILGLVDEFTISAGEAFVGFLQDAGRIRLFGVRTDGGGGNPASYNATTYSEGSTRVTRTFITRAGLRPTPGFPPVAHIENVGVYPDILGDIMTADNLSSGGADFVAAFQAAIVALINEH